MNRSLSRLLILSLVLLPAASHAAWRGKVRSGDKKYEQKKYDEALLKYLEALEGQGDSSLIHFDLGNVYQAQERFEEAGKSILKSLSVGDTLKSAADSLRQAEGLYNLGNALFGAQKYTEAVQAYKTALQLHPAQKDYLYNLELALHQMKQPPQQQPDQQQQNKKDQQDQDSQQQQQQDQQQQQEEQQQEQQQQEQKQKEQEQLAQQQQQPGAMSKEDAEKLLNIIQTDEKKVQENLRQQQATEVGVAKDW